MTSILAAVLIAAATPAPAPMPRLMTAQDQFRRECAVHRNARGDLTRSLHATIRGAEARLPRATWRTLSPQQRMTLYWSLAYAASCPEGRRGDHVARVLDRSGRLLARQPISTTLECHGDHAVLGPGETIYLC